MKKHPKNKTRQALYPWPGRFLNSLPRVRLLYPLYLTDQLRLCDETLSSPRVPSGFDGFSMLFVSDIHFGPLFSREQARRLTAFFEGTPAETLLIGGDIGMDRGYAADCLKDLKLPQYPLGVFAVSGNHDAFGTAQMPDIAVSLEEKGIRHLVNQTVYLNRNGDKIRLCGLKDFVTENVSPDRVMPDRKEDLFTVLLLHNPDQLTAWESEKTKVCFDLCCCGHTHGGQVALFGHSVISSCDLGDHYRSGWYEAFGGRVLVSNGVGTSVMPVRLGARPQVHKITLRRSEICGIHRQTVDIS